MLLSVCMLTFTRYRVASYISHNSTQSQFHSIVIQATLMSFNSEVIEKLFVSNLGKLVTQGNVIEDEKLIPMYSALIGVFPKIPTLFIHRAQSWFNEQQYQQALQDLNKCLELLAETPSSTWTLEVKRAAYLDRALVYQKLKQCEQVIEDYTSLLIFDPENKTALYQRALSYEITKNNAAAISDYTKLIELDAKNATAYFNRARCHVDDSDKLVQDYSKFIEINKSVGSVGTPMTSKLSNMLDKCYFIRGVWFQEQQNYYLAIKDFQCIKSTTPLHIQEIKDRLIQVYTESSKLNQHDPELYLQDLTKLIELNPDNPDYYFKRHFLHKQLNFEILAAQDFLTFLDKESLKVSFTLKSALPIGHRMMLQSKQDADEEENRKRKNENNENGQENDNEQEYGQEYGESEENEYTQYESAKQSQSNKKRKIIVEIVE